MVLHKIGLRLFAYLLLIPLLAGMFTTSAFASVYGRGSYGSCAYQACTAPSPTVVTTLGGLEVSINLTNGQTIPIGGYTIIITPLNASGSPLKQADIYVNGELVKTALPAETGTIEWLWKPQASGSATVKIVVFDADGNVVTTQQFTVNVSSGSVIRPQEKQPTPTQNRPTSVVQMITGVARRIVNAATQAVKALPRPVVHSFPYTLFLLLGIYALLLLLQTQRELREYHTLQALLERSRVLDEAKQTFVALVSHYLRTPLAIVLGGIDLLSLDKTLVASNTVNLRELAESIRKKVEGLIKETRAIEQEVAGSNIYPGLDGKALRLWHQRGLFVPISLIFIVWLIFNYLVAHARTFSVGQIELTLQSMTFAILSFIMYQVFRYRQLRRLDMQKLQSILSAEESVSQARDNLIQDTVAALRNDLTRLDTLVSELMESPASRSIQNGDKRFHDILAKFAIAGQLQGSHSNRPFVNILMGELLARATQGLAAKAAAQQIVIKQPENLLMPVQDPDLLSFVLSTVLDNAVSHSRTKGSIEVAANILPGAVTISITDHGEGIPANKLPLLFQPFSKIEGVEVFSHEGMGFSLYLDRLIMMYLDGNIELYSGRGKGTRVVLHLPQG